MAHKKAAGSCKNGRDSAGRRLGFKKFGGERVEAGTIIVRQRGTVFHLGDNVFMGKDHTIHAGVAGNVKITKNKLRIKGSCKTKIRQYINVIPA